MPEPTMTTESVRYALNGAFATATRRDQIREGETTSVWAFNIATVLASMGIASPYPYTEKIAETEEERDDIGSDLVNMVSDYQGALKEAQDNLQEALLAYFPDRSTPTGPAGSPTFPSAMPVTE